MFPNFVPCDSSCHVCFMGACQDLQPQEQSSRPDWQPNSCNCADAMFCFLGQCLSAQELHPLCEPWHCDGICVLSVCIPPPPDPCLDYSTVQSQMDSYMANCSGICFLGTCFQLANSAGVHPSIKLDKVISFYVVNV
jgi:hypothetical protein